MEMEHPKTPGGKAVESTQKYLDIEEVKENTIVLKDGSLRAVVVVSSTNFALKSEDEQNASVAAYQNFINSLDFPVQILIHSRVLDINSYLEKLRGLASAQTNELLRIQITEYIEYVASLVQYASIMNKIFYVVVPYSAAAGKESFTGRLAKFLNPAAKIASSQEDFERTKVKLEERINHVIAGLGGIGLRSIVLNTQELIELLYSSYNFEFASPLRAEEIEGIEIQQ